MKLEKVINWWKENAKLYLLYALLIYLFISPFIKQIPAVSNFLPEDKYVIPMISACLYLMMQIIMAMFKGEDKELSLQKFEDIASEFEKRLKKAKHLDILCSSSETFYPILKNIFLKQKITCRMIFRHPLKDNLSQRKGLQHFIDCYTEIKDDNKECKLSIKFSFNTFSRLIIIDNSEVYFGFYKLDNNRLRAKDLEMIHAKTGSYLGNFILNISKNRFDSLWGISDNVMLEREKIVY